MRHRKHTFKVGRTSSHRRSMLSNMVCSLIRSRRIKTTLAKAREARRLAEKMVTLGKKGSLHHRRRALAVLKSTDVVRTLFADIAPMYASRPGGYSRIIKLGTRRGDGAEMCLLEFLSEADNSGVADVSEAAVGEEATASE